MELSRLPAFVHDRIPCVMWRVDRVDVGLYALYWHHLPTFLPAHHDHWQSCGMNIIATSLLL